MGDPRVVNDVSQLAQESALAGPTRGSELLPRVALGDREAFSRLHELVSGPMFSTCYRILKDRALAEDAVQETMAELWRTAQRYDDSLGTTMSWSLMIARRRAIDIVRRTNSAARRDHYYSVRAEVRPFDEVVEAVIRALEAARLRELFAVLSERQRSALHLVYYEEFSMAQAALMLGIPVGTMKTRVRDAVARLRREYQPATASGPAQLAVAAAA